MEKDTFEVQLKLVGSICLGGLDPKLSIMLADDLHS